MGARVRARARAVAFLVLSVAAMLCVAAVEFAALPLAVAFDPKRYWYQR